MQRYCPLKAQGGLHRWRTLTSTAKTLCSHMKAEETAETVISAARLCLGRHARLHRHCNQQAQGHAAAETMPSADPWPTVEFLGDLAGEASDLLGVPACHWTDYKGF